MNEVDIQRQLREDFREPDGYEYLRCLIDDLELEILEKRWEIEDECERFKRRPWRKP
jgi:hypothetical protein